MLLLIKWFSFISTLFPFNEVVSELLFVDGIDGILFISSFPIICSISNNKSSSFLIFFDVLLLSFFKDEKSLLFLFWLLRLFDIIFTNDTKGWTLLLELLFS